MKIKLLRDMGVFHNHDDVKRGDVVDIDNANAERYCKLGYAVPVGGKEIAVETAVPIYEERKGDSIPEGVSVTTAHAVDENVGVPVLTDGEGEPVESTDAQAPHKAPLKHAPAKVAPKAAGK